jgi:hypothetical protein
MNYAQSKLAKPILRAVATLRAMPTFVHIQPFMFLVEVDGLIDVLS